MAQEGTESALLNIGSTHQCEWVYGCGFGLLPSGPAAAPSPARRAAASAAGPRCSAAAARLSRAGVALVKDLRAEKRTSTQNCDTGVSELCIFLTSRWRNKKKKYVFRGKLVVAELHSAQPHSTLHPLPTLPCPTNTLPHPTLPCPSLPPPHPTLPHPPPPRPALPRPAPPRPSPPRPTMPWPRYLFEVRDVGAGEAQRVQLRQLCVGRNPGQRRLQPRERLKHKGESEATRAERGERRSRGTLRALSLKTLASESPARHPWPPADRPTHPTARPTISPLPNHPPSREHTHTHAHTYTCTHMRARALAIHPPTTRSHTCTPTPHTPTHPLTHPPIHPPTHPPCSARASSPSRARSLTGAACRSCVGPRPGGRAGGRPRGSRRPRPRTRSPSRRSAETPGASPPSCASSSHCKHTKPEVGYEFCFRV